MVLAVALRERKFPEPLNRAIYAKHPVRMHIHVFVHQAALTATFPLFFPCVTYLRGNVFLHKSSALILPE